MSEKDNTEEVPSDNNEQTTDSAEQSYTPEKSLTSSVTSAASKIVEENETVQKAKEIAADVKHKISLTKKGIKVAKSTGGILAKLILNPITWIIIALIVILLYVLALPQTIGKNDNAMGCEAYGAGSGGTSVLVQTSEDLTKRRNSVAAWLGSTKFKFNNNEPLTTEQIAGFIGNMTQESNVDPTATQGHWNDNITNKELLAIPSSVGGKAVGLVQWDGGRRTALVQFAESQGKPWNDLQVQLDFLKKELDGSEGAALKNAGYNEKGKTVNEYVDLFNRYFERSGDWKADTEEKRKLVAKRHAYAADFLKTYNGGQFVSTVGGSCLMQGQGVDMSDAVSLAISISYPTPEESKTRGDLEGGNVAPAEYKEAKRAAMEIKADPWATLYASCDRFVATVIILTKDSEFPWGATGQQREYMKNSPKWEMYTDMSQRAPGDVLITDGSMSGGHGHVVLYLGVIDGKDSIAHASYTQRVGAVDNGPYAQSILNGRDMNGRGYIGFRFVG